MSRSPPWNRSTVSIAVTLARSETWSGAEPSAPDAAPLRPRQWLQPGSGSGRTGLGVRQEQIPSHCTGDSFSACSTTTIGDSGAMTAATNGLSVKDRSRISCASNRSGCRRFADVLPQELGNRAVQAEALGPAVRLEIRGRSGTRRVKIRLGGLDQRFSSCSHECANDRRHLPVIPDHHHSPYRGEKCAGEHCFGHAHLRCLMISRSNGF